MTKGLRSNSRQRWKRLNKHPLNKKVDSSALASVCLIVQQLPILNLTGTACPGLIVCDLQFVCLLLRECSIPGSPGAALTFHIQDALAAADQQNKLLAEGVRAHWAAKKEQMVEDVDDAVKVQPAPPHHSVMPCITPL